MHKEKRWLLLNSQGRSLHFFPLGISSALTKQQQHAGMLTCTLSHTHTCTLTHICSFFILGYKYTCTSTQTCSASLFLSHTPDNIHTRCWDSDMCCGLIQLFYLLNNLASIERGEREEEGGRRGGGGRHGCAERIKAHQYPWAVRAAWTSHHVTQHFRKIPFSYMGAVFLQ